MNENLNETIKDLAAIIIEANEHTRDPYNQTQQSTQS